MSQNSKKEYLKEIAIRYRKSDKEGKKKILDEYCKVCNYNRKYAIRKLNQFLSERKNRKNKRAGRKKKYYTEGVIEFIKTLWIKSNLICS
ncbi:MAG TPA: hypothetical protein PK294_04385 [Ignavibacteria bacterium]|nr:hypothetical protein [Ignavibacteria bacterium]HRA99658.1 hypothetical protein [Ignavibacteria bacterium]